MSFQLSLNEQDWKNNGLVYCNDGIFRPSDIERESMTSMQYASTIAALRPQKPSILTALKRALSDDYNMDLTHEGLLNGRNVLVNGFNLSTLTQNEINAMSIEDASNLLKNMNLDGTLYKKGFRCLRLWKRRYFVLKGNEMFYYDKVDGKKPRRRCEITSDAKIRIENIVGHPYAFSMIPFKGQPTYLLEGCTVQQRDLWVQYFNIVQMITRHICTQSQQKCHRSIQDEISLQETLGKGKYGVVRLGRNLQTGEMCAVKVINKRKVENIILQHELIVVRKIMETIAKPDLVQIKDIFEDTYLVYVVMEYLGGGDLQNRILKQVRFSEQDASYIINHIGNAIQAMHEQHIYHLDIKPENMIYESNDTSSIIKLADFGCSLISELFNRNTNEIVGTVGFIAPEVISNCDYTCKADVYSLGVTLFILLMGYPPFKETIAENIMSETVTEIIEYNEFDWSSISPEALVLVKNMLLKDPLLRWSIHDVLAYQWVTKPIIHVTNSLPITIQCRSRPNRDLHIYTTLPGSLVQPHAYL